MCLKNVALTSNLPKLVFGYLHIVMNNGISMLYVINNDQILYRLERNLVHIRTLHSIQTKNRSQQSAHTVVQTGWAVGELTHIRTDR